MKKKKLKISRIGICFYTLCIAVLVTSGFYSNSNSNYYYSNNYGPTTTTTTSITNNNDINNITIVIRLDGQLGNYLKYIAFAVVVQDIFIKEYSIPTHFIVEQNNYEIDNTMISTTNEIQKCFPNLQKTIMNNTTIISNNIIYPTALTVIKQQQNEYFNLYDRYISFPKLHLQKGVYTEEKIHTAAKTILYLLKKKRKSGNIEDEEVGVGIGSKLSTPFIYADTFLAPSMMEKYYWKFQELFQYDYDTCCSSTNIPDPNESVFHFRGYLDEIGTIRGKKEGREELDPNRTAYELFHHLIPDDKIAITSMIRGSSTNAYLNAFQLRGLQVRQSSGENDFCFLLQTQKELVGLSRTTYFYWAAILGNATIVRFYTINSTASLKRQRKWNHQYQIPQLRDRFQFVSFLP